VKKPTLIDVCGPNGSGKTSITRKILKHERLDSATYINPDDIANNIFGDWNSPEAISKAAKYASEQRYNLLEERKSVIFETVFSSSEKIDFIARAKEFGYFIRIFFVCADSPTINASRIARRVIQGGHDVPIPKIISRYSKSIVNCALISKIVDRLISTSSISSARSISNTSLMSLSNQALFYQLDPLIFKRKINPQTPGNYPNQ
jgi:predicted ABC-type ATPase